MENITFTCTGGEISAPEKQAYIDRGIKQYGRALKGVEVALDGDFANITYHTEPIPFERIRRITGYLVGTLDRFNNAKRAEEKDRVKHSVV